MSTGTPTAIGSPAAASSIPVAPPETSGKAVASMVFGFLFFIPFAFLAAIVFGHIALSEIKKSAGRLKGEGMAIAGLVLGYMWIAGIPLILIIAAIAIPNLLRARMAANEASAVASVRSLNNAESAYASTHPDAGFTCSLSDLSGITPELVSGRRNGYVFELSGCTPGPDGRGNFKYYVVGYPLSPNQTGVRAFCSSEDGVIRVNASGSANACLEAGEVLR